MFISKLINSIKNYFKEEDIRDIEDLPFNNNDNARDILSKVNENFLDLSILINNNEECVSDLIKEYKKLVDILKEESLKHGDFYYRTIKIYGIDNLIKFNNDIIDTHKTFCEDKLYKEMCDLSMGFIYVPEKRE